MEIYSVAHSNHTWEVFRPLLTAHGVQVLVDVRSNPVSGRVPFANKRTLPAMLERESIGYVFLGDSLGGKRADPTMYDGRGRPNYRKMRATSVFNQGIDRLVELAKDARVAAMCAEEDPGKCHRLLLLGPALAERGVELRHVRGNGSVNQY